MNKYSSLEGLRAFAAIGIVMMHVLTNIAIPPSSNYLTKIVIPYFTNFTFLFMIVSAFALSCGYYDKVKNGEITPDKFYSKRYLRIWPFFALLVLIDVIMDHSIPHIYEAYADLTLCFNLLPNPDIKVIGVGWFLGIIFLFYMVFPFFIFLMDNKRRAWFVLLVSLFFCWVAIHYFSGEIFCVEPIGRSNMVYSAPFFIVGGLIYLYRLRLANFVIQNYWLVLIGCAIITVVRLAVDVSVLFVIPDLLLFSAWLIYAIGSHDKVLNNWVVRYLSSISMEIYLCHMMFFRVVEMMSLQKITSNGNALYVLTFLLTLGGAIIFSHVVKFIVFPRVKWLN